LGYSTSPIELSAHDRILGCQIPLMEWPEIQLVRSLFGHESISDQSRDEFPGFGAQCSKDHFARDQEPGAIETPGINVRRTHIASVPSRSAS
jgi:hypothetical protein